MKDLGSLFTFLLILILLGIILFGAIGFYPSWILTSSIVSAILGGLVSVGAFFIIFRFMSRV